MKPILLLGLSSQGLTILRYLSRHGFNVVAFSNSPSHIGFYSKFGDKRLFNDMNDLHDKIRCLSNEYSRRLDCIICSGEILASVILEFPELYKICNVQSGPFELIEILSYKDKMYNLAGEKGLTFPKGGLLSEDLGHLEFPMIFKKNFEVQLFFKVKKIKNKKEFDLFKNKIPYHLHKYVFVQEYIDTVNASFITFQAYFHQGISHGSFCGIQQRRLSKGLTSCVTPVKDRNLEAKVIQESEKLLCGTKYTGFIEIEFIYYPERDDLVFMEVNTRACGTHGAFYSYFPKLPTLFENLERPPILKGKTNWKGWVNIMRDIRARIESWDLKNLEHFFTLTYDILDFRDLNPFLRQFLKIK